MNITVKGRHIAVKPEIRDYAEEKVGRIGKYLNDGAVFDIEIELWAERNPSIENNQVAEVTVRSKGPTIRAREAATDMHAAIDMVSDKLERRIKKYKGKVADKHGAGPTIRVGAPVEEEEEAEPIREIVKKKALTLKPMTSDEAVLQMELLGHDFFVFASADDGAVNVLYRRRDGDYGVIAPRPA